MAQERRRIVDAIAAGGEMGTLLTVIKEREQRYRDLEAERRALAARRGVTTIEAHRVREELLEMAGCVASRPG